MYERDMNEAFERYKKEASELQQAYLDFETFTNNKDLRVEALRNLRNPWPPWNENNKPMNGHSSGTKKAAPQPPEAAAAPIPHNVFRRIVREAEGYKAIRQILRAQLLRCEIPQDVMRITAVAMQTPVVAKNFAALTEPIIRALYRCRNNVSDPEILRTIKMISTRFDMAGLDYARHMLFVGVKFAARARSLSSMKWFLKRIRANGEGMSSNIFRSIIAKFSIGHRGLGEIRNGRWRREQLLQVLTGFDDCAGLPPDEQYHLGSFMIREDWQYLHGWVAVLARCRDVDGVIREWEMWRESPARCQPRALNGQAKTMTTKLRGEHWFLEQMTYTRDLKRAWKLLEETGLDFRTLKPRVKSALLEGLEHAPCLNEDMREAMIWKYDLELSKIEKALGVTWSNSTGSHTLIPDQTQEESLECLAAHDFGAENEYGFPYDDAEEGQPIVESRERDLHDAREERDEGIQDGRPVVYKGWGLHGLDPPYLEEGRRRILRMKELGYPFSGER